MISYIYDFTGNLSLKGKILLWIMPITILGLLSINLVAYKYIHIVIERELSNSMLVSVGKSAESINRWLSTIMLEPETIASTPAAKLINEDFERLDLQNINRHKILHDKYPDIFQDIYAANSKGEYHTVLKNGSEYSLFTGDIANRPYFISIMDGGPTQITPPLVSRTTGIPTIFLVAPILDNKNKPLGLIGAGISLQYIQQIGKELKAGKTGYGFIVSQDGTYIHHPNSDFIMQKKITEHDISIESDLGKHMVSGNSGVYLFSESNQKMVAFYQPIPITGWSVATVLPEHELFAPANRMIKLQSIITVSFTILMIITILLVMRKLTNPLQILAAKTQEIAAGNLEGQFLDFSSNDEIGSLAQSFNIMTDHLKRTLSVLEKSEDNYRGIFENSIEGILQITFDGQLLNVNPAMARMLGYDSAESLTKTHQNINQLYVKPDILKLFLSRLEKYGSLHNEEFQLFRKDHEIIWVSISATLVRDDNGDPLRIESLVIDINDRKLMEQEREEIFGQLAQAQKLEAVGQLAGGVAHDFNNMLSVILGHTELALIKTKPSDPFFKTFTAIQEAAEHSTNLTRQLLGFARKQDVSPKVIDLNRTVTSTFNLLKRLITEDIELSSKPVENVWPVFIDPDQVVQILTNLCVNARDAITGVGKIIIETQNILFDDKDCANLVVDHPGKYVCLSVSDNGSGMDNTTKKYVFDPFFTTKKNAKGTGLGLATVYGIAKQNNAFIDFHSEIGKGTTFNIYIPRSLTAPLPLITESKRETLLHQQTVLLVEDEPSLLDVSKTMLEELGCVVLAAGSPAKAIEKASDMSNQIDILLTDVVMPVMNGQELALFIQDIRPDVKCLFMSGYTADIIATKGLLNMGINFIHKPFTTNSLSEKIHEVMSQH